MTKQITTEVKCCFECCYCEVRNKEYHCDFSHKRVSDVHTIPEWCELDNYNE